MPDHLKKFLQDHRSELDQAGLPADLFDRIADSSLRERGAYIRKRRSALLISGIAASFGLLILALFLFRSSNDLKANEAANVETPQDRMEEKTGQPSSNATTEAGLSAPSPKTPIRKDEVAKIVSDAEGFMPVIEAGFASPSNRLPDTVTARIPESRYSAYDIPLAGHPQPQPPAVDEIRQPAVAAEETSPGETPIAYEDPETRRDDDIRRQYLGQKVKVRILSFLSLKSRKWTNNKLIIDTMESGDRTLLTLSFNSRNLSFRKSLTIDSKE